MLSRGLSARQALLGQAACLWLQTLSNALKTTSLQFLGRKQRLARAQIPS